LRIGAKMVARLICLLGFLAAGQLSRGAESPRVATADEIGLLNFALGEAARDFARWSFTEARVIRDEKGKVKSDTVVRVDPSKPYAEQFVPISVGGKPPSERDLTKYRRQGERAQKRDEQAERGEVEDRPSLGEVMNPYAAQVASADDRAVVFAVPLRPDRNNRFPPEKFEVLVRVAREGGGVLEQINVRLRESFRSKLVVKVKSGGGVLEFARVDPKRPPALVSIKGDASASILFFSVGGELDLKRTELKWVKPYAERFGVQIGTLKAIDF
jgi:hypothetical protein